MIGDGVNLNVIMNGDGIENLREIIIDMNIIPTIAGSDLKMVVGITTIVNKNL